MQKVDNIGRFDVFSLHLLNNFAYFTFFLYLYREGKSVQQMLGTDKWFIIQNFGVSFKSYNLST